MRLVQKDGLEYVKASVNRLTCVCIDWVSEIMLTEYKARVNLDRARKKEDQIDELRMTDRMDEDSIFYEVESDDPDQFELIEDEKELCQILHHAAMYEKEHCLHAVGNTKSLLSCTKMQFVQELYKA